jgi:chaperone LolA
MSTIVLAKPQNKTLQTIRETYEKITTIEADFSQSVTFDGFDTTANSNGKVYFKKGKMRWDYSAPTRQQIFVDGETLFHYTPENKQVLKSLLKKNTGLPLDLFFNIEKLEALFHITPLEKTVLLLKPKEKGSHIQQMRITLAPLPKLGGLFIKEIVLHEENGNQSQFQFKNYRINKTLSEEVLSFKIPEGVELIELHP